MKINNAVNVQSFGRAFTTREKNVYKSLIKDARTALGHKDTAAIVFDFNVPSEQGYNLGIGTSFSEIMPEFAGFLKDMTGITSIQAGPQGKITYDSRSPYSGTNYALGGHIIDLKKFVKPEYASILTDEDIQEEIKAYKGDRVKLEYRTDYENALGNSIEGGALERLLKKAYMNFIFCVGLFDLDALKLYEDFKHFKEQNKDWLEKENMFSLLSAKYGTDDYEKWEDIDKNLYTDAVSEKVRARRIKEIRNEDVDLFEYENFKQFISDKQQKETRKALKDKGLKLYGDCLLGFSKSEVWAFRDCFKPGFFYGGPDPKCESTNGIQTWGLNALDYSKIGECAEDGDLSKLDKAGRLLYRKYSKFFERYDGLRMDAAWQFITPFLYKQAHGRYKQIFLPEMGYKILNIVKAAAKNTLGADFNPDNPDNIMLELVGLSADKSVRMTKNIYPHLYTTAYAQYDETPVKYKQRGFKPDKFYIGAGNHDNDSLVNLSRNTGLREKHLNGMERDFGTKPKDADYPCPEYIHLSDEEKKQENFRNAKFAEIFTSPKQFFTLPDMFGMSENINVSGRILDENWRVRIPNNYEEFYFSQLSKGYGLNVPKAYETAMNMKNIPNQTLKDKLAEAALILRRKGPMTEEAANEAEREGRLENQFRYDA